VDLADPVVRFLWGALGALAPEIVRIYRINTGVSKGKLPVFGYGYFVISLAYAVLAGFIVIASAKTSPLECLWIGASIPAIISYLARHP
jgi:hypothetical protein